MQNDQKRMRQKLALIVIAVFLLAGIIGALMNAFKPRDDTGGEFVAANSPAFLVLDNKSYRPLNNLITERLLREDLAFFARKHYDAYETGKQPYVTFYFDKKVDLKGSSATFNGRFDRVKNKISVSVSLLKNDRIKTSITDTKTRQQIDSQLPSRSQRNLFIASLPIETATYSIDYSSTSDLFTLTIFDGSSATVTEAENALKAGLKVKDLSQEKYELFAPN